MTAVGREFSADLILMMEYFDWTREEARMNYMVNLGIQYALNIEEDGVELSLHSLQRYIELLSESETLQEAMNCVTDSFVKELHLDLKEQRVDSTNVFSNMAVWSRRKLLWEPLLIVNYAFSHLRKVRLKSFFGGYIPCSRLKSLSFVFLCIC